MERVLTSKHKFNAVIAHQIMQDINPNNSMAPNVGDLVGNEI